MLSLQVPTLRQLWEDVNHALFWNESNCINFVKGARHASFNNLFFVDSAKCDLDLALDGGYMKSRWARLLTDYLVPERMNRWLDDIDKDKLMKKSPSFGYLLQSIDNGKHRGGPCFLGFSFKVHERTPELTLYSRIVGAQRVMILDACLMHVVAKEIGQRVGFDPSECKIVWYVDSIGISAAFFPVYLQMMGYSDIFEQTLEEDWGLFWDIFFRWQERYRTGALEKTKFKRLFRHYEFYQRLRGELPRRRSIPVADLSLDHLFNAKPSRCSLE